MDIQSTLARLLASWPNYLIIAIRVIFIAVVFEAAAWFLGRKLEALAAPFASLDQNRDNKWRAWRGKTLRSAPKTILRVLLYSVALVLIFDAFGVQILPLSLSIGAIALLVGAALIPNLRDYANGFFLLAEDSLAPGDVVEINGHVGTVERWTLRATTLRDGQGRQHVLSNREIASLVILKKSTGQNSNADPNAPKAAPTSKTMAFDPLGDK